MNKCKCGERGNHVPGQGGGMGVSLGSNRLGALHLQYWKETTVYPWDWSALSKVYALPFRHQPSKFSRIVSNVMEDPLRKFVLC